MDHTGSLPDMVELIKPEKIFCSSPCKKALIDHFHRDDWPYEEVSTGRTICTGRKTMQFLETRMLHWPDSMFTYIKEDNLLVSNDAFGQHWATGARFNDEVERGELLHHAAKYYANILLPYSNLVQKLLATVKDLKLTIDMIATDHGLIWRTNPGEIVQAYDTWSLQRPCNKAVIIYDTMWESTEAMALAIADGLIGEGITTEVFNLKDNHRSKIMTEVLDASAVLVGSSTINNGMLPVVQDMLSYMKGLKPLNKITGAFGSYGWSGEAVDQIREWLEKMKWTFIEPALKVRYVPRPEALKECVELGKSVARTVKDTCREQVKV
jgi:flavorubredoxin